MFFFFFSPGRIGQEMLMEEDYVDDEIETELAPIVVQLAYVRQVAISFYIFFLETSTHLLIY